MQEKTLAVVGIGATGTVLAATLLKQKPDTILVDPSPGKKERILARGLHVSGAIARPHAPVSRFYERLTQIEGDAPDIVFISTKTCYLQPVLDDLKSLFRPGMAIVSTHNGLGTEDVIAEQFGNDAAFRMSLNFGAAIKEPGVVETAFFNRPNPLGCLDPKSRRMGEQIAGLLTNAGLDTAFVDDIKLYVWKKMVLKCTMASICAVTGKTIREALQSKPGREIADGCFKEVLAVARSQGYDLGEAYMKEALAYLENVGVHKDSMCADLENHKPTEIDFLGGKVVAYARAAGIDVPFYTVMTNLVKELDKAWKGK